MSTRRARSWHDYDDERGVWERGFSRCGVGRSHNVLSPNMSSIDGSSSASTSSERGGRTSRPITPESKGKEREDIGSSEGASTSPSKGSCHICGDPGHWAPKCPQKSKARGGGGTKYEKRDTRSNAKTAAIARSQIDSAAKASSEVVTLKDQLAEAREELEDLKATRDLERDTAIHDAARKYEYESWTLTAKPAQLGYSGKVVACFSAVPCLVKLAVNLLANRRAVSFAYLKRIVALYAFCGAFGAMANAIWRRFARKYTPTESKTLTLFGLRKEVKSDLRPNNMSSGKAKEDRVCFNAEMQIVERDGLFGKKVTTRPMLVSLEVTSCLEGPSVVNDDMDPKVAKTRMQNAVRTQHFVKTHKYRDLVRSDHRNIYHDSVSAAHHMWLCRVGEMQKMKGTSSVDFSETQTHAPTTMDISSARYLVSASDWTLSQTLRCLGLLYDQFVRGGQSVLALVLMWRVWHYLGRAPGMMSVLSWVPQSDFVANALPSIVAYFAS